MLIMVRIRLAMLSRTAFRRLMLIVRPATVYIVRPVEQRVITSGRIAVNMLRVVCAFLIETPPLSECADVACVGEYVRCVRRNLFGL